MGSSVTREKGKAPRSNAHRSARTRPAPTAFSPSPTSAAANTPSPRGRQGSRPKRLSTDLDGETVSKQGHNDIHTRDNDHPSPNFRASPEETAENEVASDSTWVLPASTVGGSRTDVYSPFHSATIAETTPQPAIEDAAQREVEKRNAAINATLLGPDAAVPAKTSATTERATDDHDHTFSAWVNDEVWSQGSYSIFMQQENTEQQPAAEATSPVQYATDLTSPMADVGRNNTSSTDPHQHPQPQPQQQLLYEQGTLRTSVAGSRRTSTSVRPPSAVAWRSPPAPPPASSHPSSRHRLLPPHTQQHQQHQPQPQALPSAQPLVSYAVVEPVKAIEVATVPPPSPSKGKRNSNVCSVSPAKGPYSNAVGTQRVCKRASMTPSLTEEPRLPNLGSVLGPSSGLLDREAYDYAVSSLYQPSSRWDEKGSASPCPSAFVTGTPSLRTRPGSALTCTDTATEVQRNAAVALSPLGGTVLGISGPTPTISTLNSASDFGSGRRDRTEDYGSFMSDYVNAMTTAAATPAAAATNYDATRAVPPTSARETQASTARASNTAPRQGPQVDNSFPAVRRQRDVKANVRPQTPLSQSRKTPQRRQQKRESNNGSTDKTAAAYMPMSSSLLGVSPPEAKLSARQSQSPMDSPMELFLPYARSLRPRQWQYASILHKKIEEKTQVRRAKKAAVPSPRRALSRYCTPGVSEPASRPTSSVAKQRPLPQLAAKTVESERAMDSNAAQPSAATGHAVDEVEDLITNSYFFNSNSVVISASMTPAASAGTPQPLPLAMEKVMPAVLPPKADAEKAGLAASQPNAKAASTALEHGVVDNTNGVDAGEGLEEGSRTLSRMSSLLSENASVFTDNGYPLIAPHLSDLYKDSISSPLGVSGSDSVSATMEGSREHMEPTATTVDSRRVIQGVGYDVTPLNCSAAHSSNTHTPTKRAERLQLENFSDENVISVKTLGKRPPVPSRRCSATVPMSPATRQQMLHEQQRRLLREQQVYVRQLRKTERPPHPPSASSPKSVKTALSNSPLHDSPRARAAELRGETGSANVSHQVFQPLRSQKQLQQKPRQAPEVQVPPPLPMPPSRSALARDFFTGPHATLNVDHCGTTGEARPQPDIKYGPFVATDKSRNIDFKKTLGFGLEDVPTVNSPDWSALPPPDLNEATEQL